MGKLYIVATPIGNLEDITLRALRILNEVNFIAAEDTRVTRKLLSRYNIHTKLISFHDKNEQRKIPYIIRALSVGDVALVSDAGTPVLNDPGYPLLLMVRKNSIPIVPVPGPSALTTTVSVSSIPTNQFIFLGFLPRKTRQRRNELSEFLTEPRSLFMFESPYRLVETLNDILDVLGDRWVCISRELTKFHEEIFNGKVSEATTHFQRPIGEFSLIISGYTKPNSVTQKDLATDALLELRRQGRGARESASEIAKITTLSRRDLYRLWLDLPPNQSMNDEPNELEQ